MSKHDAMNGYSLASRVVIGVALWILASFRAFSQAAASAEEERLIEARGYLLSVKIQRGSKTDAPTIVLESGGGWDSSQWATLQPRLSAETGATVVSYDRPGYGKSPLPAKPYDIIDELEAFHDALVQLKLADSVLLVGHSYGGLLIQLYANRWPATARGLLFLDPNSPIAMLAMGEDANQKPIINPTTPRQRANARTDAAGRTPFAAVYEALLPQNISLIVVSAEKPPFPKPRQIEIFKLSHELLAASVEDGKRIIAKGSNHLVPAQRPDLVIECVKELLSKNK